MSIVLDEASDSGETTQSARCLVPVKDSKFSHPPWQVLISNISVSKDLAVSGAVHGFKRKLLLFDIELEHVWRRMLATVFVCPGLAVIPSE
jgi:hypothetical protein